MTWVKLDDQFFRKPKARQVGLPGRALFLAGLCYCAGNLTDGVIPKSSLPVLLAEAEVTRGVVQRLVAVGWWEDRGDHYLVPDFLEFNMSRADVEGRRDAAQARMTSARSAGSVRANNNGTSTEPDASRPRTPKRSRAKAGEKYLAEFDALWAEYPRKLAKQDALRAYSARRKDGIPAEDLALAAKHYAADCSAHGREAQFVMHGATFFGPRDRWRDYLEPPAEAARDRHPLELGR